MLIFYVALHDILSEFILPAHNQIILRYYTSRHVCKAHNNPRVCILCARFRVCVSPGTSRRPGTHPVGQLPQKTRNSRGNERDVSPTTSSYRVTNKCEFVSRLSVSLQSVRLLC